MAESISKGKRWTIILSIAIMILSIVIEAAVPETAASKQIGTGHKPLFPLDGYDYLTFALLMFFLIIASAGGIGGGGILVPIYIIVLGFSPKHAVALSNVTILGGAIANVCFASQRRHPHADKPAIEFDVLLLMEPMTIMGAVVGSIVNKVLPSLLLTVSLVLVLSMLAHRTMSKGLKLFKKEGGWQGLTGGGAGALPVSTRSMDTSTSTAGGEGEKRGLLSKDSSARYDGGSSTNVLSPVVVKDEDAVKRIQEKERRVALWKPLLLSFCFAGMAALQVAKKKFPCGSLPYWLLVGAVFPWVIPFFLYGRHKILKDYKVKHEFGYPFPKGSIKWTPSNSIHWPLVCMTAGLMAGLFGIGGGMVKSPLLMEMGLPAICVGSTSATMILFTSASATISFLIFNLLPYDYGVLFFFWGMFCTTIGASLVSKLLTKHKKQSIVVLSIGIIISISVVTMGIQSILRLMENPKTIWQFGSLCSAGTGE